MVVSPGPLQRMFRSLAAILLLTGVLLGGGLIASVPADAATVSRVVVEGNTRVDDETVRAYVTIKPGQSYGPADVDESIDVLFATGLFENVTITQQGGTLVVRVVENAVINRVNFEGNRRVSDEILQGTVQSRSRSIFSRNQVQSDVQRILDLYRSRGSYLASVEPKVIDRGQNRVDLIFDINEGAKTSVGRITFIGNRAFSDGRLRDVISTKESGILGFLRTTDTYDPARLQRDQETLRKYYFDRGFADFRILSASADYDRERNEFFITFTLDEGERYNFGEVRVDTTLADLNPDQLRRQVKSRPGRRYSASKIEDSLEDLTLAANRDGYPFADVVPSGERNFETNTIDVVYRIDQGVQAYVERIEISGNTTTRDYVIRREFDIAEGDAYNRVLIDRAERRLNNLGFFETVRITTRQGSQPDRVIVDVSVVEKATGKIQFGIGYSTSDGVIGDISIEESNFLGRGQFIRGSLGGGANTRSAEFAFTEPYLFGRRLAGGFDIYANRQDATNTIAYDTETIGGGLTLTAPLTEDLALQGIYQLYNRDVTASDSNTGCTPPRTLSLAVCQSLGERTTSLIGGALIYNSLDSQIFPRDGIYAKGGVEYAGVGGDVKFLRATGKARYYHEILPAYGVVGFLKAEGGAMEGIDNTLTVPDQFMLGGGTIRGFESNGIGPRDRATGEALGGRYYVAATAEAFFPLPFIPPEIGLSAAAFADAGSLWGADPNIINANGGSASVLSNDFDLRASAGVGVMWKSPFGPIRADFAWPLAKNDADYTQVFRLSGGTSF